MRNLDAFAPVFEPVAWSDEDKWLLAPFFTNLDGSVYVSIVPSPELIGALCSRASRAAGDLREVFRRDFVLPFMNPDRLEKKEGEYEGDDEYAERIEYGERLRQFIGFLHGNSFEELFANPKARAFYLKWLAAYGDDSIAQMAGTHLAFTGISQPAMKHLEDQRIGLAPIEQSTRYVDYSGKIGGQFRYYVDPTLADMNLEERYRAAMDGLFETYTELKPELREWVKSKFPDEKDSVVQAKALDTLRGLLPASTLSQVAFFGNGQAFEYLISRSRKHPLGEIRWIAERAREELEKIVPSFLRRVSSETALNYQTYLGGRGPRMAAAARYVFSKDIVHAESDISVRLVEFDPDGENKVITGMLYGASGIHQPWDAIYSRVKAMSDNEKQAVVSHYLEGRTERWQKVGRAFENAFVRFEIVMDIGAYRDLHRHRMHTQERQSFSCHHGYAVPAEVVEAGLEVRYRSAIERAHEVFDLIERRDPEVAQYAVPMANRIRFYQYQNLRAFFWETELRTIPEGHPNYRRIEQEKFRLLEGIYPLITPHVRVNMGDYDFARRGQAEKIAEKEKKLGL